MRHRENSAVVVLIFSVKLTVDLIARAAGTIPFGATSLYHKIGNHPVECKSVIKTFLREVDKVLYCLRSVFSVELYLHVPDRKSTRLNSSHVAISYAVFCLKT